MKLEGLFFDQHKLLTERIHDIDTVIALNDIRRPMEAYIFTSKKELLNERERLEKRLEIVDGRYTKVLNKLKTEL
jgi:hypothetical protein